MKATNFPIESLFKLNNSLYLRNKIRQIKSCKKSTNHICPQNILKLQRRSSLKNKKKDSLGKLLQQQYTLYTGMVSMSFFPEKYISNINVKHWPRTDPF